MLSAVEQGYPQRRIARSSYEFQKQVNAGEKVIVGVNRFRQESESPIPTLRVDEVTQRAQIERLKRIKAERDQAAVKNALQLVREAAHGSANLVPPIIEAAKASASQQEICDVLRGVFGTYTDPAQF
jgi:methylmalonyl-CoA mutase N-terminal domain/subunit